jgi:hypothetical protein
VPDHRGRRPPGHHRPSDRDGRGDRDHTIFEIFPKKNFRKTGSILVRSAGSEMRARQIPLTAPSDIASAQK